MDIPTPFRHKVHLISYLVTRHEEDGGDISRLKAIKMLFLADVYAMRHYGVSVTGDTYYAMNKGPVPSALDDIIKQDDEWLSEEQLRYVREFLKRTGTDTVTLNKRIELDGLSDIDRESIDRVYEEFRDRSEDELIAITHQFSAWNRHSEKLRQGSKREEMDIEDVIRENDGVLTVPSSELERAGRVYGRI